MTTLNLKEQATFTIEQLSMGIWVIFAGIFWVSAKLLNWILPKAAKHFIAILQNWIVETLKEYIDKKIEPLQKDIHSVVNQKNTSNMAVYHLEEKFDQVNKKIDKFMEQFSPEERIIIPKTDIDNVKKFLDQINKKINNDR